MGGWLQVRGSLPPCLGELSLWARSARSLLSRELPGCPGEGLTPLFTDTPGPLCFRAPRSWPRRSWPTSPSSAGCGTSPRWSSAHASGSRTARPSPRASCTCGTTPRSTSYARRPAGRPATLTHARGAPVTLTHSGNCHTLQEPRSDLHTPGVIITHMLREPRSHSHTLRVIVTHTPEAQVTHTHSGRSSHTLGVPGSHSGRPGHTHTRSGGLVTLTFSGCPITLPHSLGDQSHSHTFGEPGHTHTHAWGTQVTLTHTQGALVTHTLRVMSYTHTQGPWSHSHTLRVPWSHTHTHTHTLTPLLPEPLQKQSLSLQNSETLEHGRRGGQRSRPEGRQAQLSGHPCPGHVLRLLWGRV